MLQANGEAWRRPTNFARWLKPVIRAKIDPPVSFHGLRHTWASHAVMNGVPLLVVAKNLGHADTRMVEKHYGHLAPSYIADAIRAGAPNSGSGPIRRLPCSSERSRCDGFLPGRICTNGKSDRSSGLIFFS